VALDFGRCLKTLHSVIDDNKIFVIVLEKICDFPPFDDVAVISEPESQVFCLMDPINTGDSHELFLDDALNFISLVVLDNFDCQLSFVGRATFEQQWFFDGGVTDCFKFLKDAGNQIILGFSADSDGLLHNVDSGFGFLAFKELIESLDDFSSAVGALNA
jgi:hypothetical protein